MNKKVEKFVGKALVASLAASVAASVPVRAEELSVDQLYANAFKATQKALTDKTQASINQARAAIKLLPAKLNWAIGEFSKQVDTVQGPKLSNIVKAIKAAQVSGKQADIDAAKALIEPELPATWKNSYSAAVDAVQKALNDKVVVARNKALETFKTEDLTAAGLLVAEVKASTNPAVKAWAEAVEKQLVEATTKITVKSAVAINQKTLVLTLSQPVKASDASNFTVTEKDNQYAVKVVDSVSTDKNVVTLKFADVLTEDTNYVVSVASLVSDVNAVGTLTAGTAEFGYKAAAPASITLTKTTVATGDTLGYVIKDANGNDITPNFTSDNLEVETSNEGVVSTGLEAGTPGYVVVNVKIKDTSVETGNTIVNVKSTLLGLTSIGKVTLSSGDFDNVKTDLFKSNADLSLVPQALDQNGDAIEPDSFTFRSSNPTVAVVDETTGAVTPVSAGTANITVTATLGSVKVSKTVAITVKDDAKATSLRLSTSSVKLVKGSDIGQTVKVEVLDQYGNVFDTSDDATVDVSKDAVVVGDTLDLVKGTPAALTLAGGKGEFTLLPGTEKGTVTVTVKFGSLSAKTVSASLVDAGTFVGYSVQVNDTKLDLNGADDNLKQGPVATSVKVYEKDNNGNFIKEVTDGITLTEQDGNDAVTTSGVDVTSNKVGSETVTVKVNSVKVGTVTFTVVNTAKALTRVSQVKNAVNVKVGDDLTAALLGTDEKGAAFVGYDQYGNKLQIPADVVTVISSNKLVVDGTSATGKGTATLTVVIDGKLYTVTAVVTE